MYWIVFEIINNLLLKKRSQTWHQQNAKHFLCAFLSSGQNNFWYFNKQACKPKNPS